MELRSSLIILLLLVTLFLIRSIPAHGGIETSNYADEVTLTFIGRVINTQDVGENEAEVRVFVGDVQQTLMIVGEQTDVAYTHPDGSYVLDLVLSQALTDTQAVTVEASRPGFRTMRQRVTRQEITHSSGDDSYVCVPDIVLPRVFNPAFFLATAIFLVVFGLISFNLLHETISAFRCR